MQSSMSDPDVQSMNSISPPLAVTYPYDNSYGSNLNKLSYENHDPCFASDSSPSHPLGPGPTRPPSRSEFSRTASACGDSVPSSSSYPVTKSLLPQLSMPPIATIAALSQSSPTSFTIGETESGREESPCDAVPYDDADMYSPLTVEWASRSCSVEADNTDVHHLDAAARQMAIKLRLPELPHPRPEIEQKMFAPWAWKSHLSNAEHLDCSKNFRKIGHSIFEQFCIDQNILPQVPPTLLHIAVKDPVCPWRKRSVRNGVVTYSDCTVKLKRGGDNCRHIGTHLVEWCPELLSYQCPECDISFTRFDAWKRHALPVPPKSRSIRRRPKQNVITGKGKSKASLLGRRLVSKRGEKDEGDDDDEEVITQQQNGTNKTRCGEKGVLAEVPVELWHDTFFP